MILDDDIETVNLLRSYVEMTTGLDVAYAGTDPRKALLRLQTAKVDILIIDMEMPKINGLEFLAQIRERVRGRVPGSAPLNVIVCSAHRDYAADTFGYDVSDFLMKPLNFPRFMESIDRIRRSLMVEPSATALAGGSDLFLFRLDNNRKKRINYNEIIYLEADNNYCKAWVDDETYYIAKQSLKETLMILPRDKFERVHRSFAVAYEYIDCIEGDNIKLRHISEPIPKGNRERYRGFSDWDDTHTI